MRFSEWLKIDETRFKGFYRQYKQDHPNVPAYVLKQTYTNHMSPGMNRSISKNSPNLNSMPSQLMQKKNAISGVNWNKKPQIVVISPLSFNDETLNIFRVWKFGMKPNDNLVRNDTNRFNIQGQMAAKIPEGENEPIIMVRDGNKFKLIEGFHRVMSYLLSMHSPDAGAPEDHIEYLRSGGDPTKLDFSKWKPVKIKAYLGGNLPNMTGAGLDNDGPDQTMLWVQQ